MTVYSGPDIASKQMLEALQGHITEYKQVDLTLASADGDKDDAIAAFIESSEDETVVKLKTQIEKLEEKLQSYAEQNATVVTLSDDEKAKYLEKRTQLTSIIRKGRGVVEDVAKTMAIDVENVMAALNELGDPTKGSRGRKAGQTGSSLPRVSGTLTIKEISEGGDQALVGKVFDSFSQFAMKFGADVKDLQLEFAKEAKVAHAEISSVKHPVDFAVQINENGAVYILRFEPKERAPRKESHAVVIEQEPVAESA